MGVCQRAQHLYISFSTFSELRHIIFRVLSLIARQRVILYISLVYSQSHAIMLRANQFQSTMLAIVNEPGRRSTREQGFLSDTMHSISDTRPTRPRCSEGSLELWPRRGSFARLAKCGVAISPMDLSGSFQSLQVEVAAKSCEFKI